MVNQSMALALVHTFHLHEPKFALERVWLHSKRPLHVAGFVSAWFCSDDSETRFSPEFQLVEDFLRDRIVLAQINSVAVQIYVPIQTLEHG